MYISDDDSDVRDSVVWLLASMGIKAGAYPGPEEFLATPA